MSYINGKGAGNDDRCYELGFAPVCAASGCVTASIGDAALDSRDGASVAGAALGAAASIAGAEFSCCCGGCCGGGCVRNGRGTL